MPIYEYECDACSLRIERLQRVGDPAPPCPQCDGPMQRLLSAPAFQFKGSGWYVTDYAGRGSEAKDGDGAPTAGDGGKEAGGDGAAKETAAPTSKPTAAADAKPASSSKQGSTSGDGD